MKKNLSQSESPEFVRIRKQIAVGAKQADRGMLICADAVLKKIQRKGDRKRLKGSKAELAS